MDVQLIASGSLATLFAGGGPPVVHQWPSVANHTLLLPPACHIQCAHTHIDLSLCRPNVVSLSAAPAQH